jgi:ferredoxin/flavodoxin---NADP+ reductase
MPFEILEARELAPKNKMIKVKAPLIAKKGQAGQFAILKIDEVGERIPLTLADWDSEKRTVTFIFQEVGKSSRHLGTLKVGDFIQDCIGPLGIPTHVEKVGTVVCVGGGLGIAPLYPIARAFHRAGNNVITIIGARSKDLLFYEDELKSVSAEFIVCTDDGSKGLKGFVVNGLQQVMAREGGIQRVFAIGPPIMMKVVCEATREKAIPTMVSLNPIMVDGTGMCGACRVEVGGETKFACVDGPDFDGHAVDFDLLMSRLRMYDEQEKDAVKRFEEKCGSSSSH